METPLSHLLEMPDDLGAYEPTVERAPLSALIREPRSDKEELSARAKTTATLFQHGLEASIDDKEELVATQQFQRHIQQLPIQPNTLERPAVVLKLTALISEYDFEVVRDASQMRTYVTNRLIEESAPNMPANIRIRALESLGKITGVDLFTERTEITVKTMTVENIESKLHEKLRLLLPQEYAESINETKQSEAS